MERGAVEGQTEHVCAEMDEALVAECVANDAGPEGKGGDLDHVSIQETPHWWDVPHGVDGEVDCSDGGDCGDGGGRFGEQAALVWRWCVEGGAEPEEHD